MKRIKNLHILMAIILAITGTTSLASSDDHVLEIERLLMDKGVLVTIEHLAHGNGLEGDALLCFAYTNRMQIESDLHRINEMAFDSLTTMNALMNELDGVKEYYSVEIQAFANQVKETPDMVATTIASIQAVQSSQSTQSATQCSNVGFESGAFTNWVTSLGYRRNCAYASTTTNISCFGMNSTSYANANTAGRLEIIQENVSPPYKYDPIVGEGLRMVNPDGGNFSLRLENYQNGWGATEVSYEFVVDANQPFFEYSFAVVLEDPGVSHPNDMKPFFSTRIKQNSSGNYLDCGDFTVIANPDDPFFGQKDFFKQVPDLYEGWKYCDWHKKTIPLHDYIGQTLTITFLVSDCPWGGHLGYAYIDGTCFNGQITQGPCDSDGTRELSFIEGFDSYRWKGNEVIGDNDKATATVRGSNNFKLTITEGSCEKAFVFQPDPCPQPQDPSCDLVLSGINVTGCDPQTNQYSVSGTITLSNQVSLDDGYHVFLTNGYKSGTYEFVDNNTINFTLSDLFADGESRKIKAYLFKDFFFEETVAICEDSITYSAPSSCAIIDLGCNCISSFAPFPEGTMEDGKTEPGKYVISAWVRQDGASPTLVSFPNPYITVNLRTGVLVQATHTFRAEGLIIEGWQRISEEFTIPAGADNMEIVLGSDNDPSLFDDVRIYPVDGNMRSYVYDPVSLRLIATLDENNYASFYEYDNEGKLVRTKKETERGIITISENRENSPKTN